MAVLLFFCLQFYNLQAIQAAGKVLSIPQYSLTQIHTHTHTYARSFDGTHLVPYTFTCHLRNQHSKAPNTPHRQQLECRTQHPSPLHSSSFAHLSQGARGASAYLSCHADRAVIIDFSLFESSRSQRSNLLIILLLSCRLIFCLAHMAANITTATTCNSQR